MVGKNIVEIHNAKKGHSSELYCPMDAKSHNVNTISAYCISYGYNGFYMAANYRNFGGSYAAGAKISRIKFPSLTMNLCEIGNASDYAERQEYCDYSADYGTRPTNRHAGGANCAFPDGHVEKLKRKTLLYQTSIYNSPINKYYGYSTLGQHHLTGK